MTDVLTKSQRSYCMSRISGKNTGPELEVRRLLHSKGYRYRLHVRNLPGCPDLVFKARRAVILVNGCFWHRHRCGAGSKLPRTRPGFWRTKLAANKRRDVATERALRSRGWRVLTVWECQLRRWSQERLARHLEDFLAERPRPKTCFGDSASRSRKAR